MNCELRDYYSLYLLGLLEANERIMYEKHLLQGCEECDAERTKLSEPIELMARADARASLRPEVKQLILQRIKAEGKAQSSGKSPQVWKRWQPVAARGGLITMRSDQGEWEEIGIEGIKVKKLFADPDQRIVTMLVRMAAGTAYPSHRHAGVEECYVLEGDLHVGEELVLHAGDYQRASAESVHMKQWTENGCLLFIVSSTADELLE